MDFARDERNYTSFHDGNTIIQQIGLQEINAPPGTGGVPEMDFSSGIRGLGYELPSQDKISRNLSLLDNVSRQKGQFTNGFTFQLGYTWAKNQSDNNGYYGVNYTGDGEGEGDFPPQIRMI